MFLSHSRKAMKKFRSVFINKRQRIPKGKSKMDNPEKLVAQSTQDEGEIKNGQSRETGSIEYTRRRGNQKHNTICV